MWKPAGYVLAALCFACSRPAPERPSILLVTLDTTRADSIGPEAKGVETPAFNAVAARGRRFRQAYATVPETLPSHSSMLTGLYPAGHGVHENGRFLAATYPVLAERLKQAGYRTAAFVSSFTLSRRFGLDRGFDLYDNGVESRSERSARETTDAALARMGDWARQPVFVWVHYFDPHAPYAPPEPFKSRYSTKPYLGEIAAMDEQLGRLLQAFEQRSPGSAATIVVADHGEGLGDHGEALHGNLAYQSTMHVPLVMAGPGVKSGVADEPVSTRRVYHTVLDWAGVDATNSLRGSSADIVLGEAMKPFLEYGWQPQVMSVKGPHKFILAGTRKEIYDVIRDPAESRDLAAAPGTPPQVPQEMRDYPVPSLEAARPPDTLSADERRTLASLGYASGGARPVIRPDAPRPVDMAPLFADLDRASTLFVQERYAEVIPLLESIRKHDPNSLDVALRLGTAHSILKHETEAMAAFTRAAALAPTSVDVRLYLALHYARGKDWAQAAPLLEQVLTASPERVAALEGLADLRQRQGRVQDSIGLLRRLHQLRPAAPVELVRLGLMAMETGQTDLAIASFEHARREQGQAFRQDLELGAVYFAARRLAEARDAFDRVSQSNPGYPMALFKRAQVSVLLNEPDRAARIDLARRHANAATRELIAKEKLFQK
jgi:arylsulfatase A-like enzyme/tetratricopeptide (TPR) repeat protein